MNERATATQSHNPRDDAAKAVPLPYKCHGEKVASKDAPQGLHALADPMQKPSSCKHSVELSSAQKKWKLIYYWARTRRKRWEKWEKPFLLWIIIFRRIILWLMTRLFQKIIFSLRIFNSCAQNDNHWAFSIFSPVLLNVFSSFSTSFDFPTAGAVSAFWKKQETVQILFWKFSFKLLVKRLFMDSLLQNWNCIRYCVLFLLPS